MISHRKQLEKRLVSTLPRKAKLCANTKKKEKGSSLRYEAVQLTVLWMQRKESMSLLCKIRQCVSLQLKDFLISSLTHEKTNTDLIPRQ